MQQDLKQLIIGSMLGDGHITKCAYNSRFQIGHAAKSEIYLTFKRNILANLNMAGKLEKSTICGARYKKCFSEVRFRSKASKLFTKLRKKFYPNGKKCISYNLVKNINDLGLAIWYMDDGNKTKHGYELNTQSFSVEEKTMLQKILFDK